MQRCCNKQGFLKRNSSCNAIKCVILQVTLAHLDNEMWTLNNRFKNFAQLIAVKNGYKNNYTSWQIIKESNKSRSLATVAERKFMKWVHAAGISQNEPILNLLCSWCRFSFHFNTRFINHKRRT